MFHWVRRSQNSPSTNPLECRGRGAETWEYEVRIAESLVAFQRLRLEVSTPPTCTEVARVIFVGGSASWRQCDSRGDLTRMAAPGSRPELRHIIDITGAPTPGGLAWTITCLHTKMQTHRRKLPLQPLYNSLFWNKDRRILECQPF